MEDNLNQIRNEFLSKIQQADNLQKLDELFLAIFGKSGAITLLPKNFSKLTKEELASVGSLFNQVKQELEKAVDDQRTVVRNKKYRQIEQETVDFEKNIEIKLDQGCFHPLTEVERQIVEIFSKIGFQQYDAPHIDTDSNNFEALNIPQQHPARDMWDTLYLENGKLKTENGQKLLLRTHTSNAQIRILKELELPIRMLMIGRCFRYENVDARHEHTFDQFELVYVDKGVSMANLQYLAEYFLQNIFSKDIKVRLRPKYYPFVEPGAGIDGLCLFCKGKGCKICGQNGWLELGGAGMIHPYVLKNAGIDPNEYSGIAWGFGPPRMSMLKYGIDDVRAFNSGDVKVSQLTKKDNNESK